jgi:hypothetical protein
MAGYSEHDNLSVHPEEGMSFRWLRQYRRITYETILELQWSTHIFRK